MKPVYQPKTEQFRHQREHFAQHATKEAWGCLWEQGTGKTKEAIDEAAYLFLTGEIDAVVVVAPNGVHRNWKTDELPKHLPDAVSAQTSCEVWTSAKSSTKRHQRAMSNLLRHEGLSWLLLSYDAVMTDAGRDMLWAMLSQRRTMYILDEAHNIKTPGSKRTKRVLASARYAAYRRILTGTPIATGPFDIYSQVKFLDDRFWFNHNPPLPRFSVFKHHFGEWLTAEEVKRLEGYDPGFDRLIRYRNLDELTARLKTISSRVLKEDVLDLPPKLYSRRWFELTPLQERLLNELRDNLVAILESGKRVEAPLAITRLLRAQQITCGYVASEAGEPAERLPGKNPRLDCFAELEESISTQGIVWARFKPDIDILMDLLGKRAVRYDGSLSDDEAERSKRAFQAGDAQWFVGNPQKGKEGLTLVQGKAMVYYSNSFKLIDRLQSEDRAHRFGQDVSLGIYDIVTPRVDNHIVNALRGHFDIATKINGDRLREWI